MEYRIWTDEEINYLVTNYKKIPVADIASSIGRTMSSIRKKAVSLKLTDSSNNTILKALTKDEKEFIRIHYGVYTVKELSKILNKDEKSIKYNINKMYSPSSRASKWKARK